MLLLCLVLPEVDVPVQAALGQPVHRGTTGKPRHLEQPAPQVVLQSWRTALVLLPKEVPPLMTALFEKQMDPLLVLYPQLCGAASPHLHSFL